MRGAQCTPPLLAVDGGTRLRILGSILFVWLSFVAFALADAPEIFAGRISISDVSASAARAGEDSRLRFTLSNDGADVLNFLGTETDVARQAVLTGRVGHSHESSALDSLTIAPDEILDLNTSHLWVSLQELHRPLIVGDTFAVTLRFSRGNLPVIVHVH